MYEMVRLKIPQEFQVNVVGGINITLPKRWQADHVLGHLRTFFSQAEVQLHGVLATGRTLRLLVSGPLASLVFTEEVLRFHLGSSSDIGVMPDGMDPILWLGDLYNLSAPRAAVRHSVRKRRRSPSISTLQETMGQATKHVLGVVPVPGCENLPAQEYADRVMQAMRRRAA